MVTLLSRGRASAELSPASAAVPHFLQLAAAASQGTFLVSSGALNFGSVAVGNSATRYVTLTWTGSSTISVTSDSLSGSGFSVPDVKFPFKLKPQVGFTVAVHWNPAAAGAASGQLGFTSQGAGQSSPTIALSGSATAPAASRLLQVNPSPVSFGSVALNGTATQSVTLTSVGAGAITVLSASVNGSEFKIVGGKLPYKLGPQQSTTLKIQFTAAASGGASGQLTVTSNATAGSTAMIALSGSGGAGSSPQLSSNPNALNFGSVPVNTPTTQNVTLTSSGTAPVTVSSATTSGSGYSLLSGALPTTLAPNQSVTLQLQFDPTTQGQKAGQLTVQSNASGGSPLVIALSGSGQTVAHSVSLGWNAPTSSPDPIVGYNIYRSPDGSTFQKLNGSPQSQTTYTDSTVTSGTTYTYEVKSVDAQSVESTASNVADVAVP